MESAPIRWNWTEPPAAAHPWARRVAFVSCGVAVGTLYTFAAAAYWLGAECWMVRWLRDYRSWPPAPALADFLPSYLTLLAAAAVLTPPAALTVSRLRRAGPSEHSTAASVPLWYAAALMLVSLNATAGAIEMLNILCSMNGHPVCATEALRAGIWPAVPALALLVLTAPVLCWRKRTLLHSHAWALHLAVLAVADTALGLHFVLAWG